MNDVKVGVEVPATTINSTPTSGAGNGNSGSNNAQSAGENGVIISTTPSSASGNILPGTSEDADLAIFAIIFIIIAIVILVLVFREKLLSFYQETKKKINK